MDNEFRDPSERPLGDGETNPAESTPREPAWQLEPAATNRTDTAKANTAQGETNAAPVSEPTPTLPPVEVAAAEPQPEPKPNPVPGPTPTPDPYQPFATAPTPSPAPVRVEKRGPGWGALLLAMILTAALSVVLTLSFATGLTDFSPKKTDANDPVQTGPVAPLVEKKEGSSDWQAVANAVRPATVSIQVVVGSSGDSGSGVVWDSEGHIVTNNHVVADAQGPETVTVSLNDGRLYHAEVVGTDPTTDLAVLKLIDPPSDLVSANFGASDSLTVGQPVMAIGSPLGLSDTVTTGIISALDRPVAVKTAVPRGSQENELWGINPFEQPQREPVITNAIQIDASINPGNSGGPLFDESGQVIGINSSIASLGSAESTSGSIGLGFAIPVDLVKNVATQLINNGKAEHAQLGVMIRSAAVTVDGVTKIGAEVSDVVPGGAAASADIQAGDVILKIDGHDVVSSRSLTGYVRRYNSGDEVTLTVARGGKSVDIPVVLKAKAE